MTSRSNVAAKREDQVKFAQGRISLVEKYYGLLCDTLGSVIRKSARLRDKGDLFSQHLKEYADNERINGSSKVNLTTFAQNFSAVQDYRHAEVQRLEEKVLKPLTRYGKICKNMKSSVRSNQNATKSEAKQLEKLEKLQQKGPADSPELAQADLQRMRQVSGNFQEQLLSEMDRFEKEKLSDLKSVLSEYVKIEMMFHARALKYLSKCYQAAQRIDEDADMDQFRAALMDISGLTSPFAQTTSTVPSFEPGPTFGGMTSSSSQPYSAMYSLPQRPPGIQGPMYDDDDDDDSEDEDDEDDEDNYSDVP